MAKRFKEKLSRVVPSLQLCRPNKSKASSLFPGNTIPAIYRLSPINPKSFDISFPSFSAPAPPSTPDRSFTRSHHVRRRSKLSNQESSSEYTRKKDGRWHAVSKSQQRPATKPREKACEENEAPLLSRTSISFHDDDSSTEFFSERSSSVETVETTPASTSLVPQKLLPREVEGKVRESVAVVKRSEDPLEDFRRSMWEMVVQKEMFTAEDLEQLLLCFLSLNSRQYHPVIVEAFSEIWQLLFSNRKCSPPSRRRVSKSSREH
ncbi:transcription repressor OFP8-like [Punica granatum]|uniref:Transcription repressor n=1 Tax=Punica granatum TaxID=22663 RepID=A0A6P8C6I3_PUNGR|nr:transcription repressor OFP8-like [Punica granatum]